MPVEVIVEAEASPAARQALRDALNRCGLTDSEVNADYYRKSADQLPWIIIVAGPSLAAFLSQIAKGAGDDTWKILKATCLRLYNARRRVDPGPGSPVFKDVASGVDILWREDLPDAAWQQLAELGPVNATISNTLGWDESRGEWVDPLRDRFTCQPPGCSDRATTSEIIQQGDSSIRKLFCSNHSSGSTS